MKPAISVRNLSKRYHLAHQSTGRYRTLRDEIVDLGKRFASGKWKRETGEEFWALRDISFDIQPGEIVGVIGRNGAGKSTLLKILSRITPPTSGDVYMRGRVGSLLEVGTGFHPELTGRENIFLSGAILGMKKREVAAKFDEIAAFAEVERFLDTPVKRYSSGMYVRLAFAVAAHLETEILLVDEVLAVGDAKFQEKCVGKLEQISSTRRTVLFISHNMGLINRLCERIILLKAGSAIPSDSKEQAIARYLETDIDHSGTASFLPTHESLNLKSIQLSQQGIITSRVKSSLPIDIEFVVNCGQVYFTNLICGFTLVDEFGSRFLSTYFNDLNEISSKDNLSGDLRLHCQIPANSLNEGRFILEIDLGLANIQKVTNSDVHSLVFFVENTDGVATHIGLGKGWRNTPMLPYYRWNIESR